MIREQIILLIGTLGGATIGALSGIIISWVSKIYEDKKNRREIIIKTAIEDWKSGNDVALSVYNKSGKGFKLYPLDDFILHHSRLANILLEEKLTPDDLEKTYKELQKLNPILDKYRPKEESADNPQSSNL